MLRYIDKIIIPHIKNSQHVLKLLADHKGLVIFDVFKAHASKVYTKS